MEIEIESLFFFFFSFSFVGLCSNCIEIKFLGIGERNVCLYNNNYKVVCSLIQEKNFFSILLFFLENRVLILDHWNPLDRVFFGFFFGAV